MTFPQMYTYHRYFFIGLAFLALLLLPSVTILGDAEIVMALILFFGLGIPHGALDVSLGRSLYEPIFGKSWWLFFFLSYLTCVGLIVYLWFLYPLTSFLFFLGISAIHFGFSDTLKTNGFEYFFEGVLRGVLPITTPAYFYPEKFQLLVENVLSPADSSLVVGIVLSLFYPSLLILAYLVVRGLVKKDVDEMCNAIEIISIILLFFVLTPFRAFLIYFCFLHSLRHILTVLEQMNLGPSWRSLKWIISQALPTTLCTLLVLVFFYLALQQGSMDSRLMFNLFFISLAALTFPHMLLVETAKRKA